MSVIKSRIILALSLLVLGFSAYADRDVYVHGYYRSNGTYVNSYIRKSPDQYRYNNYGPSQTSYQYLHPQERDNDNDGIPNYIDHDDDNDGIPDEYDRTQY
jgi:hypothetical protein